MNIFIMYTILIFIGIGTTPHVIGYTGLDDVSLSKETEANLTEIIDPNIRLNFERLAKIHKLYSPAMGYVAFQCAVNEMKANMEVVYPECSTPSDYKAFMRGLARELAFPEELDKTIHLFSKIETEYLVPTTDGAFRNIPLFFDSMYAFLTRCEDRRYAGYLSTESLRKARFWRAKVLGFFGLDENSSWDQKREAFLKFLSFYARIRHGCNGFHHLYEKKLRNSTNSLEKELYAMGLLQAWNFTADDAEYANLLRSQNAPNILTNPYRFEVMEGECEPVLVTGVLPIVDLKRCPRFFISRF